MFVVYDVVLIPLILGIVELFKRAGVSKKVLPFIALVIGIAVGVIYVLKILSRRVTNNRYSFSVESLLVSYENVHPCFVSVK